jgi:hypothetical protein
MKLVTTLFATVVICFPLVGHATNDLQLRALATSVPQYGKIEFQIDLDAQYDHPFDPKEVDLHLVVHAPDGSDLELPAFHMQPYEQKSVERSGKPTFWLYPQGLSSWRARFAPCIAGEYAAYAEVTDAAGSRRSCSVAFSCLPADVRGFVRVSRRDPRYFEFSNEEPFFPLGQNLAFIGDSQYVTPATVSGMFRKLSQQGVNYLRIWTCCHDWALAIEARKSAWGRSWNWHPPFAAMPDQDDPQRQCIYLQSKERSTLEVSPTHRVALRPHTDYLLTGRARIDPDAQLQLRVGNHALPQAITSSPAGAWQPLTLSFTTKSDQFWMERTELQLTGPGAAWIDALSLQEAGGGPELLWEAAINRPERGYYNPVDCAQLDHIVETAQHYGIYLQLCLITRDAYMDDLKDDSSPEYQRAITDAQNLLRYAVARWGCATSVATWEYFNENDPGLPMERFHREVGDYLRKVDIYSHLRSTSTWHPSARDCRDPYLDAADLHFYLRPVEPRTYANEVDAVLGNAAWLRAQAPAKPALIGEFGLADAQWRETREMRESPEVIDFHNALWASALSGTSGTALYWWWDRLDPRNHGVHYRPLADYLAGIPWTTAHLTKLSASVSDPSLRLVGQQGAAQAYWWLFDPLASWDSVVISKRTPAFHNDTQVEISGLQPGRYRIQWWETRTGQVLEQHDVSISEGPLRVRVPPWHRDIAGKLTPAS